MKRIAAAIRASGFLIAGVILLGVCRDYSYKMQSMLYGIAWLFVIAGLVIPPISLYFNAEDEPKHHDDTKQ